MALKRNILANYLGTSAVALGPILALPWYLAELGSKQYGLIGFAATLQATLGLLDSGMSQALVREIAVRFDTSVKGRNRVAVLLFGFERIYWMFSLLAGLAVFLMSDTIVKYWLNLDGLPDTTGRVAIYGAAAIFAVQFPGSVYRSMLVGTQKQVTLNLVLISSALFRHLGGVLVIIAWPSLPAYLVWHAMIALLETLLRGRHAWRVLQITRSQVKWDLIELRPIFRLVSGMSVATLLGALTVQMDRIVLSRLVSIEQLGYYTIAVTVSLGSLQLINPIIQAVLPLAIQLRNDSAKLRNLSIRLMVVITMLVGLGIIVFASVGEWLLGAWLRSSSEVVEVIYSMLAVLLVGTALNAFYNVGYVNWLAQQKVNKILKVNVIACVLSIVLIPVFVNLMGAIGAAFGWLAINLIGFVFSLSWLKR